MSTILKVASHLKKTPRKPRAKTPSKRSTGANQVAQLLGENHFAIADATQHATEAHYHAFRIHQRCDVGSDPKSRRFFWVVVRHVLPTWKMFWLFGTSLRKKHKFNVNTFPTSSQCMFKNDPESGKKAVFNPTWFDACSYLKLASDLDLDPNQSWEYDVISSSTRSSGEPGFSQFIKGGFAEGDGCNGQHR